MKKFKLFALTALFCGMSASAFAQTKADGHYRYEILSGTTAQIIGFVANSEVAAVEIPVQVQDPDDATKKYDVVAVAVEAFKGQTGITSVIIPDTKVATIGAGAFAGCTNLATLTIGKAITLIDNVKTPAVYTVVEEGTDLTHGSTYYTSATGEGEFVATDDAAYDGVDADTYWTLTTPAVLSGAFAGCSKLATVTFNAAAAAQEIAAGTFVGTAITNLDLTNTKVTRIERLFTDGGSNKTNAKLAEVTFPATMGTVVNDAFNGCSALATVNFVTPTGNQTINNGAFVGTAIATLDLTNSKVTAINQLFTDGTTTSNAKLATVKLAKATQDINWRAFYGCAKLSEIVWATEGTLATISAEAFKTTPSLTSLELPASVTDLYGGFLEGSSITSLTINSNTTAGPSIGVSASTKLKTLIVKGAFKGSIAGEYTYTRVGDPVAEDIATYYEYDDATGTYSLTEEAFDDGKTYYTRDDEPQYAFASLESVTFEGNLEVANAINANAFGGTKLTTATFKGTIAANAIAGLAFSGATKLATVNFEKKINANGVAEAAFDGAGTANTAVGGIKLTVNYSPADGDALADAFNVAAFAAVATPRYVALVTTTTYGDVIGATINAVVPKYDAAAVEIEVANNGSGSWYYAKFYKNTAYTIAKEQEGGAKVIAYGAYVDDADATIYMEQLHIIDGKYQIPGMTPVIIKSNTADKVKAVSDYDESSMLIGNDGNATNEISYLADVTVGQVLKEMVGDDDAAGRLYDNNNFDLYALGKIEKFNITWKKFGDATQLPAGTFYIRCEKSDATRLNVVWLDGSEEDQVTAIKTVKSANAENGAIYNLAGQKVNAAYKGVVIKDGKKYMQK